MNKGSGEVVVAERLKDAGKILATVTTVVVAVVIVCNLYENYLSGMFRS